MNLTRRAWLAALAAVGLVPVRARTAPPEVAAWLPGARLQGQSHLNALGMRIYDIRLWVEADFVAAAFERRTLAIEIEYARALSGRRIAERSLAEMQRIAPIAPAQRDTWLEAMQQAFPDVKAGERLTGLHRPGEATRFFHDGGRPVEIGNVEFGPAFFAIWLSPRTSEPRLRQALLGGTP